MNMNPLKALFISALLSLSLNASAELVNINDASVAAMSHYLKGIGDVKASSIVKYRELNGDFNNIDDLVNVKGIGKGTLKKNRENLSVTEGIVKWIKAKPKLVVLDAKKASSKKNKKQVSKKLASKTVSKIVVKKTKKQEVADLEVSPKLSKKKDVLILR